MYCEHCLKLILQKLNSNDIVIVELLKKCGANLPQFSLSIDSILEKIKELESDITMSDHNVYTSIKRLNEFGFVERQRWTRKNKYYMTEDGENLLNVLENN